MNIKMLGTATVYTTVIIFALSLLSLFGRYPYVELTTHFRLQYVLAALVCIVALGFFGSWKFVPFAVLTLIFNAYFVVPYYFATPPSDVSSDANLRLMLANVQGNNRDYAGLIEAVKAVDPDVFVLQEVTGDWWENVRGLTADYPFHEAFPRAGGSGLAFFSRYPIQSAELLTLDDSTHPALVCVINLNDTPLTVFTMHPPTPVTAKKFNYRNGQFAQIARLVKNAPAPKLLIGDLNTTVWSPYFTDLTENSGTRDARIGRGLYPSWHASFPSLLRIPIDHCLIGEKISVENIATGNYTGSDHRPLIVNLKIEK